MLLKGFSEEAAKLIIEMPKKYLWTELLNFFRGKQESTINDLIIILSKIDILSDPGPHMEELFNIFCHRQVIADLLIKTENINMNLDKLINVL